MHRTPIIADRCGGLCALTIVSFVIASLAGPTGSSTARGAEIITADFATISTNNVPVTLTLDGFDSSLGQLDRVDFQLDAPVTVTFSTFTNFDPATGLPLPYTFSFQIDQDVSSSGGGSYANTGQWFSALGATGLGTDVVAVNGFSVSAAIEPDEGLVGLTSATGFSVPPTQIQGGLEHFTDQTLFMTVSFRAAVTSTTGPPVLVDSVSFPVGLTLTYNYTPIPEPTSLAWLGLGGLALAGYRRRVA